MTLSSRHRIRNSNPGGLRPSTLPLGHGGSPQYWLSHVDGEETFFVSFKPPRSGTEPRTLAWKAAVLTTTLGPPPESWEKTMPDCYFIWYLNKNVAQRMLWIKTVILIILQMNTQWTLNGLSMISTTNWVASSRLHTINVFTGVETPSAASFEQYQ